MEALLGRPGQSNEKPNGPDHAGSTPLQLGDDDPNFICGVYVFKFFASCRTIFYFQADCLSTPPYGPMVRVASSRPAGPTGPAGRNLWYHPRSRFISQTASPLRHGDPPTTVSGRSCQSILVEYPGGLEHSRIMKECSRKMSLFKSVLVLGSGS